MSHSTVLEYFDVLAWPVVLLLLIGGFLLLYRVNVAALIERISSIKTPMGSLRAETQQPREVPKLPPNVEGPPPSDSSDTPPPSPATEQVQQLSPYVYYWYYEKMYRQTFGTQTMLMAFLNVRPLGATEAELMPYYEEHMRLGRLASATYNRDFSTYIGWLETALFVRKQDGRFYATEYATSFLQWMVSEGLNHGTAS